MQRENNKNTCLGAFAKDIELGILSLGSLAQGSQAGGMGWRIPGDWAGGSRGNGPGRSTATAL